MAFALGLLGSTLSSSETSSETSEDATTETSSDVASDVFSDTSSDVASEGVLDSAESVFDSSSPLQPIKDKEIKKTVRKIMSNIIKEEDLDNKFEIYKIGMHIKVVILLQENFDTVVFSRLKSETLKEIKEHFDSVTIEYVIRKRF